MLEATNLTISGVFLPNYQSVLNDLNHMSIKQQKLLNLVKLEML